MAELSLQSVFIDSKESIEKILEKSGEKVDVIISRYKNHVIKSALREEGPKKLSLLGDAKNKDWHMILVKSTTQTELSQRSCVGKLLKHNLEYPVEYYLDARCRREKRTVIRNKLVFFKPLNPHCD